MDEKVLASIGGGLLIASIVAFGGTYWLMALLAVGLALAYFGRHHLEIVVPFIGSVAVVFLLNYFMGMAGVFIGMIAGVVLLALPQFMK